MTLCYSATKLGNSDLNFYTIITNHSYDTDNLCVYIIHNIMGMLNLFPHDLLRDPRLCHLRLEKID